MKRKKIKKSTICSRGVFSWILERELARAKSSSKVFSVVDFDLEAIKTNKKLGKQLLQAFAKIKRSKDEVGRLKGHHMGVLLYNTPFKKAQVFSKRVFKLLLQEIFPNFTIHTYPIEGQSKDSLNYQDPEGRQGVQNSLFSIN
jgi:hypothetical protein